MKKILPLLLIIIVCSCSKDEQTATTEEKTRITYKSPELDFFGIPNKSLTNIQVGDMVKVNFEISKLTGVDVIEIKPVSKSTTFHELLNTDYELYIASSTEKDKFTKVNSLLMKLGINTFYVKPLVAGTFQLKFEDATKSYDIVAPVVFSAVKISTRIESNIDGNCGLSKWRRHNYWFSIETGDQPFDLTFKADGATYVYESNYRSTSKTATFTPGSEQEIVSSASECGNYPSLVTNIKSITIFKVIAGAQLQVATYYNIPIN